MTTLGIDIGDGGSVEPTSGQIFGTEANYLLPYLQRDMTVRRLLDPTDDGSVPLNGPNYETARETGLIDMFVFDPASGVDGLVHTLAGNTVTARDGSRQVAGFHHEPSSLSDQTYVDYSNPPSPGNRRYHRQVPFEPYSAHVVVEGHAKQVLRREAGGELSLKPGHSTMFPKEYDPLAVMQAVRIARDTRDVTQDQPNASGDGIIAEGRAPMLDNQNTMPIRMILDRPTERVITAFPTTRKPGVMGLTPEDTQRHLGLE